MGISWEQVKVNLRHCGCLSGSFVKAFDAGENVFLIGVLGNSTTVALLDATTFDLRWPPDKLSLDKPCKDIIAVSHTVYAIDNSDSLYRLTNRIPEKYRKADDYRDDGRDKYFWKKLPGFTSVAAITGFQFGLIVIEETRESFLLTTYDIKEEPIPMICVPLGPTPGEYFITSFSTSSLDNNFAALLLEERSIAASDLVVFSKPSGWVYLFPIVCEFQEIQPVEIHFERNLTLKAASITRDGKTMVLAYEIGKIVVIFLDDTTKSRCSTSFYFNTSLKTVLCTGSSEDILVISSDYSELRLATITNRSTLKIRPVRKSLPGIRFLLFINELRPFLAFSCSGFCYKLSVCSLDDEIVRSPSEVVADLSGVGVKTEQLEKDIAKLNDALYAIENEQFENSEFQITLQGSTVHLKNACPRTFIKSIWTIHVEGIVKGESCVKTVSLENDFKTDCLADIDVTDFIENSCNSLKFSLVGTVAKHFRSLVIDVGSVVVGDSESPDVENFIRQKLFDILDKRKYL